VESELSVAVKVHLSADRSRVRQKESEYEDSIEAYKETPVYHFIHKWRKRRQVWEKEKELRSANKSLRSHYYVRLSSLNEIDLPDNDVVYQLGIHI